MVQVQELYSVYFCLKIFFESWLVWLIWHFECPILMILTMTKFHENLLRDSTSSLLSKVNFFSSLDFADILRQWYCLIAGYIWKLQASWWYRLADQVLPAAQSPDSTSLRKIVTLSGHFLSAYIVVLMYTGVCEGHGSIAPKVILLHPSHVVSDEKIKC